MIGLIKKDFLMLKGNFKTWLILLFVYIVMAFQESMSLAFLLPCMSIVTMLSTFSYDSYNKWDAYVCSLPDGRKNSVRAKYIATLLLIFVTVIITTILTIIIGYYRTKTINLESMGETIMGAIFATTLLQSIMYPAIYKFGVEKARIAIFIVVFGFVLIGGVLSKYIDFESIIQGLAFLENYMMIIIPIVIIIMLYVSYKISEVIYKRKEY